MDKEPMEDEILELTDDELAEILADEQAEDGAHDGEIPEYYFSNPDPYFKIQPRPDDAPKREVTFDKDGNIVVKNLSAFWLPNVKIVEKISGTEFTVTGSYTGSEPLHKKLERIMNQQADDDKPDITEDGE